MQLVGKTAVVTGGSRGIGFEICKILLEEGAAVLAVSRDSSKLAQALGALPGLQILQADVSQAQDVDRVVEYVGNQWDKLDILVNNAAVFSEESRELTDGPDELLSIAMAVNVLGPYLCTKRMLSLLLKSDDPRVLNLGSRAGIMSPTLHGTYGVTKLALHGMSLAVAEELRGRVAVNVLSPGWVRTDMAPDAPGDPRTSAAAALFLVTQPANITGKLFQGKEARSWFDA
ncbi:MAG: NAD(P)-dependent dehydrogenase, short-chain alcohol dehydrogenase family [Chloroflexi bacterium]|jgi:NAD(P)-dependent dehydrogenase (short-subunit alcohol dehydrogenase family)|nr:MAG: NAD(P)-dependent dehydrogenase, short-chain alcohol dehydrogenase family [Chloroflexota bacterium]